MFVAHMKFAKSTPAPALRCAPPAAIHVWLTQRPDVTVSNLATGRPSGEVTLDGVDPKSKHAAVRPRRLE